MPATFRRGDEPTSGAGFRTSLVGSALLALLAATVPGAAGALEPGRVLSASFLKEVPDRPDEVQAGRLHLGPDGVWRVDFRLPIPQTFVSTDSVSWILYPDERVALRFRSSGIIPPGVLLFFATAFETNIDLLAAGYEVSDFSAEGDTTVTTWVPRNAAAPMRRLVRIHRTHEELRRIEISGADGRVSDYRILETDHTEGIRYPAVVEVTHSGDGAAEHETFRFSELASEELESVGDRFRPVPPPGYEVTEAGP